MDRSALSGFTLWELLTTVGIAAVAIGLAAPSFRSALLGARRTADINGFVSSVQLARNEAIKRGRAIVLCKSADGRRCGGDEITYLSGWIVFANNDDARPPALDAGDELLFQYQPRLRGSITANRPLFEFRAFAWRSTNGTVTFCDADGHPRAVIIRVTGRPRVAAVGPGGRALSCAPLT
jgi:type IV fimbrial biogenesis protein FimT